MKDKSRRKIWEFYNQAPYQEINVDIATRRKLDEGSLGRSGEYQFGVDPCESLGGIFG